MSTDSTLHSDSEVSLREIGGILVNDKFTLFGVTIFITLCAVLYVFIAKPIYRGEVLIEIGDAIINSDPLNDKPSEVIVLEYPKDLKEALTHVFIDPDDRKSDVLKIESPKESTKLIRISYDHEDKAEIEKKLTETSTFVLQRHQEKGSFFTKANALIAPTVIVGTLSITDDPVRPKKVLIPILAFFGGLILSIFVVLFKAFVLGGRQEVSAQ